jgi:sulfate permease, SulP family
MTERRGRRLWSPRAGRPERGDTATTPEARGQGSAPMAGLQLLRRYRSAWLRPDIVAGLTVGAMLVPQSMAYAELAGVPAVTGLYASLLAPVAYALTGTSRHLGTGPEPGTAILAATGVAAVAGTAPDPSRYLSLMAALALMVGAVAGVAWLLRLGFVAYLLSKPVLVGYISGVGFVLLSSQLTALTGVPVTSDTFFPRVVEFVRGTGQLRPVTMLLGAGALLVILALRRAAPRTPGALIAVASATIVSVWLELPARGDPTIGTIPTGLPALGLPDVTSDDLRALLPIALGVALVGFSDNVLTGRAVANKMGYRIDANQELAGLASANLGAGLLQGMPVSSSASRSAVAASLGGVSSLVSIVAAGVVTVTLLAAGGVLGAVPRAALAAVIAAAAFAIIDLAGFRKLWRISRSEFVLAVVTSLGVMVFDVLIGVVVAVALSIVIALARMARPEDAVLGARDDLDGWVSVTTNPHARTLPGLLVYRFDAPLFFMNVEHFRTRLLDTLQDNPGEETWVVLDFEGIGHIDTTALDELADLVGVLDEQHVEVIAVARANARSLQRLDRARLLAPEGPLRTFATINSAVEAFERRDPAPG